MSALLSAEGFSKDLERIKFAIGAAGIGVWELDLQSNSLNWDTRCCEILGFAPDRLQVPLEEVFGFIHPDDLAPVSQILAEVLEGGSERVFDATYRFLGADKSIKWINATGTSYFDEKGQIARFGGVVRDVTERRGAQQKVLDQREQTLSLMDEMPVAIAIVSRESFVVKRVNPLYCELVGRTQEELLGHPLLHVFPGAGRAGVGTILQDVLDTGIPFHVAEERIPLTRQGREEVVYMSISYQALYEDANTISGVLIAATDVTRQVEARKQIENSALRFQNLLQSASVGIVLLMGEDLHIEMVNEAYCRIDGRAAAEILHQPLFDLFSREEEQYYRPIINRVRQTGVEYQQLNMPFTSRKASERPHQGYVNIVYQAYRETWNGDIDGVLILVYDVTEQVVSSRQALESEAKFRMLIEEAPFATSLYVGPQLLIDTANEAMIRLWGKTPAVIGMPLAEALPELEGQPFIGLLEEVMRTGVAYNATAQEARLVVEGRLQSFWFNFIYKPLRNAEGEVYAILNMAVDVTDQVMAQKNLRESKASLGAAIELAELATWSMDVQTGAITYSERLQKWLGLEKAVIPAGGSPRVHPKDRERIAAAVQRATARGGTGKYDEVYTITNAVTGFARVIHAVGEAQYDGQGNAIRLSGIAQDITLQRDLQSALENEVQLRTEMLDEAVRKLQASNETLEELNEKLQRSNEDLAQYAYVASHDLQEPLRKIQIFSDLLRGDKTLSEKSQGLTDKIISSSARMSQLIRDLLHFSRLLQSDQQFFPVDLNAVLREVLSNHELAIEEKSAQLQVGPLPTIGAIGLQMSQLFNNLVSNSLKFIKSGIPPVIRVTATAATAAEVEQHVRLPLPGTRYHKICVEDNGIGFEKAHAEQIFEVFKRLHSRDAYPGSGIGLALCRRIAVNHGGALYTTSTPGSGATFCILLPERPGLERDS